MFRTLCVLSLALFATIVLAAEPRDDKSVDATGKEFITPATQLAINRGLDYLAATQHENGAFGTGHYREDAGVTSLAGLAFLSAGHTPGRGKYGKAVDKTLQFILDNTDASGFINSSESRSHGPMYGHGFATLFLAEAYGMTDRKEVKEKLKLAVNLIVNTQNREGGWRYYAQRKDADLSVTVCQIMALRAARNVGIEVPKSTVDDCTKYVKESQNSDGGFSYQLKIGTGSQFPRSAAGVVALYSAGIYEGREIDRGLDYLMEHLPEGAVFRHEMHYFYGHYYAVQAMWHAGGDRWRRWFPAIRDELLGRQARDGSWPDPQQCSEYGTAMGLVVLQMPNNYLPIFRR